jgi:hypothetical protein
MTWLQMTKTTPTGLEDFCLDALARAQWSVELFTDRNSIISKIKNTKLRTFDRTNYKV